MSRCREILYAVSGGVGTVTLNRPDKRNALTAAMRGALLSVLRNAADDARVRAVIVTGAGAAFCAGGDINVLRNLKESNDEAGFVSLLDDGREIVHLLRTMPKPTVAMVNGPAYGAGCFLAIACDIRLCSASASFGVPLVRLGLGPEWGGTYLLPRMIGTAKALEMMYTGEGIGAEEAAFVGLANHVWPDAELQSRTAAFTVSLVAGPAELLARYKRAIHETMDGSFEATAALERQLQLDNFRSSHCADGITAFLTRRK